MKNVFYKTNNLQCKQFLALIFALIIGIGKAYATYDYDFSAVAPSGHTLYYDVISTDDHTVGVVSPNIAYQEVSYVEGDLIIPSEVEYNGETYIVTTLLNNHNEGSFQQTNITSLVIPATINDIDGASFYRCNRLTAIYVYAKTPPMLDGGNSSYTFSGVPSNCVIHVPYGTTGLYRNAWGSYIGSRELVNMEPEEGEITAIISPEGAGTLSGTGNYEGGDTCVLTAIANTGYGFCFWSENDTIASTESSYSFMVNGDRVLVANFASVDPIVFADTNVKAICVANWDANSDGELSYDEAAVVLDLGMVFRGNTEINSFDELQYFIGLTSITEGTSISDKGAFGGCTALQSITFPNSITSIGNYAFQYCSGLTSVEIPNSVTSIGGSAFSGCSGLTGELIIPNSVTSIDGAFSGCSGLTSVEIPNSVTSIGQSAFSYCSGLTSVEIPNSVTSIGSYAFQNCNGLTGELIIPNSVTLIDYYAFSGCSGLTSVTIGNSVTTINNSAFLNCPSLTTLYYNAVCCYGLNRGFQNNSNNQGTSPVTTVIIGTAVQSFPDGSFSNFSNLQSVYYEGDIAQWCGISFIADYSNPLRYGHNLYIDDELVTDLVIPNSVTSIGNYAFSGCRLASVTIPNSVTSIGHCAFKDCSLIGELVIPNSVTTIDGYAFSQCSGLTSVTIGNSVTSIGQCAFQWCSSIISVIIGNSITSIGAGAFQTYGNLTSMFVFADNPPTVGNSWLNIDVSVYVPCGSLETYQNASGWSSFPNIIGVCSATIGVTASQSFGGMVEGNGTYDFGAACTVTAMPSQGYHFWYWKEDDRVVSWQSVFSFWVTGDRELIAVFSSSDPDDAIQFADANVKAICVANWDTNGDGELSYTEAGSVLSLRDVFRGNTVITTFDELQYFTGLASIGTYTFSGCSGLTSVEIPNSVTSIGSYAFQNCNGLTGELIIPNSVASIGGSAFSGCSGLTSVTIPNSVTSIGNFAFYGCSGLTSVEIPNSVTSIGESAFYGCSGLASVEIPNSVTTIGRMAFSYCSGLTSVVIPNSVTSIGEYAFQYCSDLTSVTMGNSVTSIGNNAFQYCSGLTAVYYLGDIAQWCGISFGGTYSNPLSFAHNLYIDNELVTELVIPNSVTSIGGYAFYGCSGLTGEMVIPNSVTSIGNCAFYGCSGLTGESVIPNSVTSIGNYAFYGCSGLTSVTIGDSVSTIGERAFYGCSNLGEVTIGEGVSKIDSYAFWLCPNLHIVHFNAVNCTQMYIRMGSGYSWNPYQYYSVFNSYNDANTTGIPHPNILNPVDSITFGDHVTIIPDYAFTSCSGLTSLTIGNSVTSIGCYTFGGCSGLTSLTCLAETPPNVSSGAFSNVSYSIPLFVPCGCKAAYEAASVWCGFTNIIEMCPFEITAIANPTVGGVVNGAGTYYVQTECTLEAVPNYGYVFVNWTEDGEVVSTDATYTFTVTEDRTLAANFQYIEQHWPMPQGYEGNMTITGTVSIDGETSTSDYLELAAFIGEECRGTALPIKVGDQRVYFLIIAGNGADEGEALSFKLYDHLQQQELNYHCTNELNYQTDLALGLDELYEFEFLTAVTITATAEPEEGGTIEGAGLHFPGLEATLTAIPATGYSFVNWTKEGTVVSTVAAYTFTVTTDESYVAHFSLNSYDITVTANPAEGGMVSGAGTYNHFATCTLTATANTGYTFQNWTLNGEEVSTDAEYTFEVSGAGDYVANFTLNSYDITATADPAAGGTVSGAGTYDHFATCTLTATANTGYTFESWTLNGEVVSTNTEYSFEVSGHAAYVAHFTLNSYEIVAIANPAEGGILTGAGTYSHFQTCTLTATAAEGFQFNSWVVDGVTVSTSVSYTFEVTGPVTVTALFDLVQTVPLAQGWTWWGTSVEMSGINGLSMLENSLGGNGVVIKTANSFVQYNTIFGGWAGTLTSLTNEAGYRIQTNGVCTASLTGPMANPEAHPITIIPDWTWIGYPVSHQQTVNEALSGLEPLANDLIKGQNKSAVYVPGAGWVPDNFTLIPGESFMYFSNDTESKTLTFSNGRSTVQTEPDYRYWSNDMHAYGDNITLLAVVEIDGEEQRSEEMELGAFVNGECRGSARLLYVPYFDRYYAVMTVLGEDGDEVEFAMVDQGRGMTSSDSPTHVTFSVNAIVGAFEDPFVVSFESVASLEENAMRLGMYPNPVNRDEAFRYLVPEGEVVSELTVVNALGAVVRHETGALDRHDVEGLPVSGFYLVRVTCKSGNVYQNKLVVR